jgi:hypothetical protein
MKRLCLISERKFYTPTSKKNARGRILFFITEEGEKHFQVLDRRVVLYFDKKDEFYEWFLTHKVYYTMEKSEKVKKIQRRGGYEDSL